MKRLLLAGIDGTLIGLGLLIAYHLGRQSIDLETACPDFVDRARKAQIAAQDIATEAVGNAEQCRRELQVCEAKAARN